MLWGSRNLAAIGLLMVSTFAQADPFTNIISEKERFLWVESHELFIANRKEEFEKLAERQNHRILEYCQAYGYKSWMFFKEELSFQEELTSDVVRIHRTDSTRPLSKDDLLHFKHLPINPAPQPTQYKAPIAANKLHSLLTSGNFIQAYESYFGKVYPHILLKELWCSKEEFFEIDLGS